MIFFKNCGTILLGVNSVNAQTNKVSPQLHVPPKAPCNAFPLAPPSPSKQKKINKPFVGLWVAGGVFTRAPCSLHLPLLDKKIINWEEGCKTNQQFGGGEGEEEC